MQLIHLQMTQPSANWDALTSEEVVIATPTEPVEETPAPVVDQNTTITTEQTPATPETKEEPVKTEEKPAEAKPADAKPEDAKPAENTDILSKDELTLDDLAEKPAAVYEDGTFKALAAELGFEAKEESFDAFKQALSEKYVPKEEFEAVKQATKESLLNEFSPEIAAAIKLKDLGLDEHLIFNPTAQHDYLLNLAPEELIRLKLENTKGYDTPEMIDTAIEQLITEGKLENLAKIEKTNLSNERENILKERAQLEQQLTEQRQQAVLKQKQEADQKFIDALNNESAFLGLKLSPELKSALAANYKTGKYDEVLNNPASKVKAILMTEFGSKFEKAALAKAKSEGRAEVVQQLSNVPPTKGSGGGQVTATPTENNGKNNWDALPQF